MPERLVTAIPLTREAFAPFGDVVALDERAVGRPINGGMAERYDDLVAIDVAREGGHVRAGLLRATPAVPPVQVSALERHPNGSQLFLPLGDARFLVVVATGDGAPQEVVAFLTGGRQGINYRRGIWHHALLALDRPTDFLVVDRTPEHDNLETALLEGVTVSVPER